MLFDLLRGRLTFQGVVIEILAVLVIIFLILPFHKWAHAFTASLLGDKGIKNRGRLSLNPISHIDPIGALCMLLFGFGWAKPVPVDSRYFKKPKLGMAITAIMGPIANLVAALAGLLIFNAVVFFAPNLIYNEFGFQTEFASYFQLFFSFYVSSNIYLAVFNLIPIPPLDGSKVLFLFLPNKAVNFCYRYQQIFFIALFALIYAGLLNGVLSNVSGAFMSGLNWLAELPFSFFR